MKLSLSDLEKAILEYWKKGDFFARSVEHRPADRSFVFYDGPPFATGLPHHGSLLASVIKDVVPRYKTMRGYRVERSWGWDCHGLPIENLVEKELSLNSKKDIEALGIGKFTNACRAAVLKYDREWRQYVDRTGRWVDFDNSYKTMDDTFIESVWWAFKTLHDKGLAYEGRHICLYCPRCATPLSNFEIAMDNSYKELVDHSTFAKFPVVGEDKTFFLAWTTTPWTLPGNVALFVDEKADYVLVEQNGEKYYIAKSLAEKVLGEGLRVAKELKGQDLIGKTYEPLFTYMPLNGKKAYYVAAADFVSLEDGTGIVHTAAIYGEDDYKAALAYDLPLSPTLDEQGKFFDFVGPFAGMFFKKAEQPILDDLKARNLLLKAEDYTHSYPVCYRCSTPLYYNAVPAWFIAVKKFKDRMLALNETINWYPEHLKHGRFGKGLETAPDWNISRNRYWGSPIPVWECSECDHREILGSVAELKEKAGVSDVPDLHRPAIDEYSWPCSVCEKGTMKRISQIFDCWVESGSMPFASKHYPFENKEVFEKNFPGEFIAEYIAQTRGWFYTLHVLSTALFDKPAFSSAVTTGTIQAEDGQKMSKSKKNYTDPLLLFDQYGADAFRFYLMTSPVMSAENLNFSDEGVKDSLRKVVMMLMNIHALYATYASPAQSLPTADELSAMKLTVLDHWLLAKWADLHQTMTTELDRFNVVKAGRPALDFINDFSAWYLRRSRDRFKGDDASDKAVALAVTRYVLENLLLVLAPYTPFVTEHLYQKLYPEAGKSVHLADWPAEQTRFAHMQVIASMDVVRQLVELALAARADAGIKIRQVCERLLVALPKDVHGLGKDFEQILADEVNVKDVQVVTAIEEQPGYTIKAGLTSAVALKTELSDALRQEGLARDVIRQINQLRKDAGLTINDRITVQYQTGSDLAEAALTEHAETIKASTLADAILPEPVRGEQQVTVKSNGHEVIVGIMKQ
ncbi:MAG: isoleucine--tRNA ligase [Parcubacteria group bacterium]|nr:isoleucine--tRNA ligase [Parcubacteria group bacterium]